MNKLNNICILKDNLSTLQDSLKWLNRSFNICSKFDVESANEEAMDAYESLTSRFARTTDLLTNKVIRSIVLIDSGETKSWLDSLLYIEKLRLIDSISELRIIKELRNEIVHEYAISDLLELFREVNLYTPVLTTICDSISSFGDDLVRKVEG